MKKLTLAIAILVVVAVVFIGAPIRGDIIIPEKVARVYNSSSLDIPTHTKYFVPFNQEIYDTGNFWGAVNPSRFTIHEDGVYQMIGNMRFNGNGLEGFRVLAIWKNHTTHIAAVSSAGRESDGNWYGNVVTDHLLYAGEFVEMEVFQSTGEDMELVTNPQWSPSFSIKKIASLQ